MQFQMQTLIAYKTSKADEEQLGVQIEEVSSGVPWM